MAHDHGGSWSSGGSEVILDHDRHGGSQGSGRGVDHGPVEKDGCLDHTQTPSGGEELVTLDHGSHI